MRFEAGESEAGRRLDRVLKKILKDAPLSFIYRIIRKDVRVNGKRARAETLLALGDVVEIKMPDEQIEEFGGKRRKKTPAAKKQFGIVFEDENILVADKPFGLLTHGDEVEKKNTLANQVIAYLAETGGYTPGEIKTFTPAPANRLDRNTTGLVLFGRNLPATQALAEMIKGGKSGSAYIEKLYLTVVKGDMKAPMTLKARMKRDEDSNTTKVLPFISEGGNEMITEFRPLSTGMGYTLVEARLVTGRTHQIRAQLAEAGFPVLGDRKYGDKAANILALKKYELRAQLLHAERLVVIEGIGALEYLKGMTFRAKPPERFVEIAEDLGCGTKMK